MRFHRFFISLVLLLLTSAASMAQTHGGHSKREELGLGAAFSPDGKLWVVSKQTLSREPWSAELAEEKTSTRRAERSLDQLTLRWSADFGKSWSDAQPLLKNAEPVSADGENRPKLAFSPAGDMVISWTSPSSARFTGDIRLIRSDDKGKTWSPPLTVHADKQRITHRFESIVFDHKGRLFISWIDRRDAQQAAQKSQPYTGAALYYAVSHDGGKSFQGDYKIADHSCECCRIALASNPVSGQTSAFWRHVFDGNERDFQLATLLADGKVVSAQRATFDRWAIEACPHHGGSLAFSADGTTHLTWFNLINGQGQSFYQRVTKPQTNQALPLPPGASHVDLAVTGQRVVLAWTRFDGENTQLVAWSSKDNGKHFVEHQLASTAAAHDQARVLTYKNRVFVVWNTADGLVVKEAP